MTTTGIRAPSPTDTFTRLRDEFFDGLPEHFRRLRMGRRELTALQTDRLRSLLRHAAEHSPFHAPRLAGVDPDRFALADLPSLPPMTKAEMMDAYDGVVTDPRLGLDVVNRHLDAAGERPALLFDDYVVLSSGGSSGVRGVFACDRQGSAEQMAAVVRGGLAGMADVIGWPPPGPVPMTIVAAPTCVHATRCLSSMFLHDRIAHVTHAPVTAPFGDVVATVQRSQPLILIGYPSVIARLADAQAEGRLSIAPLAISVTSEQLGSDQIERITAGLGVAPTNSYGTSEGLMGTARPGSDVFDFASDLAYVEFVDAADHPVGVGETAHHVLVTNLLNRTQPLIRYRIDDQMTPAPSSPDHGHQRAAVQGRNDEHLQLGDVLVHPLTIRSALVAASSVADYQVHLGSGGDLRIDVVAQAAAIDVRAVETGVGAALARAGAPEARVTVRVVDALERDRLTGKVRRFRTA